MSRRPSATAALEADLDWLARVLDARIKSYFGTPEAAAAAASLGAPSLPAKASAPWASFVQRHALGDSLRLTLLLALAAHLRPQLLDVLFLKNSQTGRGFTEFGGVQGGSHSGFLPTGQTAAFLLCGDDLAARLEVQRLFEPEAFLARENLLRLAPVPACEPSLAGALTLSREGFAVLTQGAEPEPAFGPDFPARRLHTALEWSDLVLPAATLEQLEEVRDWVSYSGQLLHDWGMQARLKPGYTALFHGPPGTGKTLSAALLGKLCAAPVYRIDLSMIVSKYIGETEKNLARVFDLAEHKRWILFFDEADALFGKRTSVDSAHDRYANQEVSFLLQRIEEFNGVVILASNLRTNIDDAFLRRFASVVAFAMPKPAERLRLWREAFPPQATLADGLDLEALAQRHEVSGGTILNVVRHACLRAIARGDARIAGRDVEAGLRREYLKEGRAA